jgi:tetratricopeptide (TPR) repeat protein
MSDPFRFIDVSMRALGRFADDLAHAPRALLLVGVAVVVAFRIVFTWLSGALTGPEAVVLSLTLIVSEAVAVKWVREFEGLSFALLAVLPLAVWVGVGILARVGQREAFRASATGDIARYEQALRRDPRNAAARELLGDAHMKLGRPQRAIREYRAALALEGVSYGTRYKLERAERLASER